MSRLHERARHSLPRLTADNYRETSPVSWEYNCVAWAASVTDAWWWPLPGRYWPDGVPREETLTAFLAAFEALGYQSGATASLEPEVDKVAVYAVGATPTHMARQLSSGWWTSKLGPAVDIEHAALEDVAGGAYGQVVAILGRRRPVKE
jgi:hypothetical protein